MLVKVGRVAVINMTGFDRICVEPVKAPHPDNDPYARLTGHNYSHYQLIIRYVNHEGKQDEYLLDVGNDYEMGFKIKDEVVSQIREVEMEKATTALENALQKGGDQNG